MRLGDLIDTLCKFDNDDAEILLEGRVKAVEFVVVPVTNGERAHGYIITRAKPVQMELPLSGNVFDPKDSIGE